MVYHIIEFQLSLGGAGLQDFPLLKPYPKKSAAQGPSDRRRIFKLLNDPSSGCAAQYLTQTAITYCWWVVWIWGSVVSFVDFSIPKDSRSGHDHRLTEHYGGWTGNTLPIEQIWHCRNLGSSWVWLIRTCRCCLIFVLNHTFFRGSWFHSMTRSESVS